MYLDDNPIKVIEPGSFARLLKLRVLDLSDIKLDALNRRLLTYLSNLQVLYADLDDDDDDDNYDPEEQSFFARLKTFQKNRYQHFFNIQF